MVNQCQDELFLHLLPEEVRASQGSLSRIKLRTIPSELNPGQGMGEMPCWAIWPELMSWAVSELCFRMTSCLGSTSICPFSRTAEFLKDHGCVLTT